MVWHGLEPELVQHENSQQVLAQDLLLAEALPKVWLGAPSGILSLAHTSFSLSGSEGVAAGFATGCG